jgi:hypothetical protein
MATSYSGAEAGGFIIDTGNALGAKVDAVMLPISDTEWHDVKNDIAGTLIGSPTIDQDATGRYVDFDGTDDAIDMGQSYFRGTGAIVPNMGVNGQPNAGFVLIDHGGTVDGNLYGERDGNPAAFQVFTNASGTEVQVRRGVAGRLIVSDIGSGLLGIGHSYVGTDDLRGFLDGVHDETATDAGTNNAEVNFSVGARWQSYPTTAFLFVGKIYLVLLFNESLSDAEHASLASNPWQIFSSVTNVEANVISPNVSVAGIVDVGIDVNVAIDGHNAVIAAELETEESNVDVLINAPMNQIVAGVQSISASSIEINGPMGALILAVSGADTEISANIIAPSAMADTEADSNIDLSAVIQALSSIMSAFAMEPGDVDMETLVTARLETLRQLFPNGPPHINDLLVLWLASEGGTGDSLIDLWYSMLISKGATPGHRSDMWFEVLGNEGFEGALKDRELAFWQNGGTFA